MPAQQISIVFTCVSPSIFSHNLYVANENKPGTGANGINWYIGMMLLV